MTIYFKVQVREGDYWPSESVREFSSKRLAMNHFKYCEKTWPGVPFRVVRIDQTIVKRGKNK